MARATGQLIDGKPIIQVALATVSPSAPSLTPSQSAMPFNLREYRALVDTGASVSCLCDHVVTAEGLSPFGLVQMTGGAGSTRNYTYIINLGILCESHEDVDGSVIAPKTLFWLHEPTIAAEIRDNRWFDVIIGTDILVQHDFMLHRGGNFELRLR